MAFRHFIFIMVLWFGSQGMAADQEFREYRPNVPPSQIPFVAALYRRRQETKPSGLLVPDYQNAKSMAETCLSKLANNPKDRSEAKDLVTVLAELNRFIYGSLWYDPGTPMKSWWRKQDHEALLVVEDYEKWIAKVIQDPLVTKAAFDVFWDNHASPPDRPDEKGNPYHQVLSSNDLYRRLDALELFPVIVNASNREKMLRLIMDPSMGYPNQRYIALAELTKKESKTFERALEGEFRKRMDFIRRIPFNKFDSSNDMPHTHKKDASFVSRRTIEALDEARAPWVNAALIKILTLREYPEIIREQASAALNQRSQNFPLESLPIEPVLLREVENGANYEGRRNLIFDLAHNRYVDPVNLIAAARKVGQLEDLSYALYSEFEKRKLDPKTAESVAAAFREFAKENPKGRPHWGAMHVIATVLREKAVPEIVADISSPAAAGEGTFRTAPLLDTAPEEDSTDEQIFHATATAFQLLNASGEEGKYNASILTHPIPVGRMLTHILRKTATGDSAGTKADRAAWFETLGYLFQAKDYKRESPSQSTENALKAMVHLHTQGINLSSTDYRKLLGHLLEYRPDAETVSHYVESLYPNLPIEDRFETARLLMESKDLKSIRLGVQLVGRSRLASLIPSIAKLGEAKEWSDQETFFIALERLASTHAKESQEALSAISSKFWLGSAKWGFGPLMKEVSAHAEYTVTRKNKPNPFKTEAIFKAVTEEIEHQRDKTEVEGEFTLPLPNAFNATRLRVERGRDCATDVTIEFTPTPKEANRAYLESYLSENGFNENSEKPQTYFHSPVITHGHFSILRSTTEGMNYSLSVASQSTVPLSPVASAPSLWPEQKALCEEFSFPGHEFERLRFLRSCFSLFLKPVPYQFREEALHALTEVQRNLSTEQRISDASRWIHLWLSIAANENAMELRFEELRQLSTWPQAVQTKTYPSLVNKMLDEEIAREDWLNQSPLHRANFRCNWQSPVRREDLIHYLENLRKAKPSAGEAPFAPRTEGGSH